MGRFTEELGAEMGKGLGKGLIAVIGGFFMGLFFFFRWLFSFQKEDGRRSWFNKNWHRLTVVLAFVVYISPFIYYHMHQDEAQLEKGQPLTALPGEKDFLPISATRLEREFMLEGIRFLRYSGPVIAIPDRSICALIPSGQEVLFKSPLRPHHVVNMEEKTEVMVKVKDLDTGRYALYRAMWQSPENEVVYSAPWEFLYEKYYAIKDNNFLATSKPSTRGGIVCF